MKNMQKTLFLVVLMVLMAIPCIFAAGAQERRPEQVVLEFFHYKDTAQEPLEKMAAAFTAKYPNVRVNIDMATTEYTNVLAARNAAGNLPDIFAMSNAGPVGLRPFIDTGKITPVDDFKNMAMLESSLVEALKVDGKSYMVPLLSTGRGLIYNEELLSKVGYSTPPATLSELKDLASKLQAIGVYPFTIGAADLWTLGNLAFLVGWDILTDTQWINDMNAGKASFSIVDEWFDFFDFFIQNTQPNPVRTRHNEACTMLALEQAAMYIQGPWTVDTVLQIDPTVGKKLRMAEVPYFEDRERNLILNDYDMYLAVANNEKREWADKFLHFMVADPVGIEIFTNDLACINPYGLEFASDNRANADVLRLIGAGRAAAGEVYQNMPTGFSNEYGARLQLYMQNQITRQQFYDELDKKWLEMKR